uniref:Uncharacterized protein n=1 Tax=Bubo bubo TaxID=30461 RepID=A0A8C0E6R7_BUBBB
IPKSRALARAMRRLAKALKRARGSQAAHQSSQVLTELSPFFGIAGFLGKRISLERYSFSLCTLACRDSVDLLRRRGSTEIPIVRANFLLMPSSVLTLSSSRLKPLPARTFLWYLIVGHLTIGKPGRGHSPPDLAGGLVEPCGHSSLPVLVEVGLQDHAIAAGRHGCCGLRTRAGEITPPALRHPREGSQLRGQRWERGEDTLQNILPPSSGEKRGSAPA